MCILITSREIMDRLDGLLSDHIDSSSEYRASDANYYLPNRDDFQNMLGSYQQNILPGLLDNSGQESCDCDNFARTFKVFADRYARDEKGLDHEWCVGQARGFFAWTNCQNDYHVCNWVILEDGHFWWVEPQDATCHYAGECSNTIRYMEF